MKQTALMEEIGVEDDEVMWVVDILASSGLNFNYVVQTWNLSMQSVTHNLTTNFVHL